MRKTAIKHLLLFTAIILFTCSSAFSQKNSLSAGNWKLIEARGVAAAHSSAFIDFNNELTRFTGNTGCNRVFGRVKLRGHSIDLYGIGATRRYCKLMAGIPEATFLAALKSARRYSVSGDTLRLFDRRGRRVLKFERVTPGDDNGTGSAVSALAEKKWILESIKGRQTFAPLAYAFVVFDRQNRSAGGDASCNVFGGDYTATDKGKITITNIISTMRACIEDNKMNQEREMLAGLRAADRFEITGGRLNLYRGSELELTFIGEKK